METNLIYCMPEEKVILEIKVPRENEYAPETAQTLFSGFTKIFSKPSFFEKLKGKNLIL